MSYRVLVSTGVGAAVIAVVLVVPIPASSQTQGAAGAPRTPWGQPDLQGVWDFRTITPMQRPDNLAGKDFLTEEEAANLERAAVDRDTRLAGRSAQRTIAGASVDTGTDGAPGAYNNFWLDRGTRIIGTRRTALIVDPPDGRIPALTSEGERRAEARRVYLQAHPADSWLDVNSAVRCIVGFNAGPPMEPRAYNNHMQLFQTPDHVIILNEMVHDARIIPLSSGPDFPEGVLQWMGDSRGRWEGDTLVVDTTNLYDKNSFTNRYGATPHMRLVERFTRVDAETLIYEFTVEDSATWTRPWTVEVPMEKSEDTLWEFACHEGNYGMDGILAGHRAEERDAARARR